MSSLPSLSSSTSPSHVASPSDSFPVTTSSPEKINPLALMGNLFSVARGSDADVQGELQKTSQVVSQFMELMTEQFKSMAQRIIELESEAIIARAQPQETAKMHLAQMQAVQNLAETIERTSKQLNDRLGALENKVVSTNQRIDQLKGEVAPAVQAHQAQVAAAQAQAQAHAQVVAVARKMMGM